jgi:cytochrome c biogenesis protein CcdA
MGKISQILKKIISKLIGVLQKMLLTILLFFIYLIGFGITFLFAIFFNRKALGLGTIKKDTFWNKPQDSGNIMDDCIRPS